MQSKSFVTLALLSVSLVPVSGVMAQDSKTDSSSSMMSNTIMDAGQFRESLNSVKDLFDQIHDNNRISLAAADPLIMSQYQEDNRRLLNKTLGVLDEISMNWKRADVPAMAGETAEARTERLGSASASRYASESEDTAFVRNTVWDLQSSLMSDKLNGRAPMITDEMSDKLNAAIKRAENPDFRVATAWDASRLQNMKIQFSEGYQPTTTTVAGATAPEETMTRTDAQYQQVNLQHDNLPDRNRVAQATSEETVETSTPAPAETPRVGAADTLPKTGGDPGLLMMLGSGLAGMGTLLRRRRS